jgi:SAM-dependent methyltransferase
MRRRVQQWKERLYDPRSGWVDGTTQFAHLIRKHLRPHMRLLDLGAGAGKAGPVNFRAEVAEVVGIDRDQTITGNGNVDRRVLGMAENLPFRAESFDLIFADWVVDHLLNPAALALEAFRVLKPGGFFIFRTGNLRHYSYAIAAHTPHWFHQLVANPVRGLPRDGGDPYPTFYRMNTGPDVRRVLTRAGFVEEELLAVEAEPSYLMFSAPLFLLGVAYERLVNRVPFLSGLRACLFGCFRMV